MAKRYRFSPVVDFTRPGETPAQQFRRFESELMSGSMKVRLLSPDGRPSQIIEIRKEIWVDMGSDGHSGSWTKFPVFYVYHYNNPVNSSRDLGRVTPKDKPYLRFDQVLRVAKEHFAFVIKSGMWIPDDQVRSK